MTSNVVPFPSVHGRTSAGRAAANASKVMCEQPFSPASRTISGHRRGGMPRERQVLTVDAGKASPAETTPVPPRSSIIVPAVGPSVVMESPIVRTMRTCQEFASRETTFPDDYGVVRPMIDPPEIIGPRLRSLRLALNVKTQVEFAKKLGMEKNTYNPFETGKRALTFEAACAIRQKYKIPVDYLFWGDSEDQLPAGILKKLDRAA